MITWQTFYGLGFSDVFFRSAPLLILERTTFSEACRLLLSSTSYSNCRWSVWAQPADCWLSFQNVSVDIRKTSFRRSLWIFLCFPRTTLLVLQRYISSLQVVDRYCPSPSNSSDIVQISFPDWSLSADYFSSAHLCSDLRWLFSVKPSENWLFFQNLSVDFIGNIFHSNFSGLYRSPAYLCSYWKWFSRLFTVLVLVVFVLMNTEHKTHANYLIVYVGIHLLWK